MSDNAGRGILSTRSLASLPEMQMPQLWRNGSVVVLELYLKCIYEGQKTDPQGLRIVTLILFYRCITNISCRICCEMWFSESAPNVGNPLWASHWACYSK